MKWWSTLSNAEYENLKNQIAIMEALYRISPSDDLLVRLGEARASLKEENEAWEDEQRHLRRAR